MKKTMRLALTAALVMSFGSLNMFATVAGTDPHPQMASMSYTSLVTSGILTLLGF